MTPTNQLELFKAHEIVRAYPRKLDCEDHAVIELAGRDNKNIALAVPLGEAHKLAQIAMQVHDREGQYQLIESLIGLLKDTLGKKGEPIDLRALPVTDWGIGQDPNGRVVVSFGVTPERNIISFVLDLNNAKELSQKFRGLLNQDATKIAPFGKHPFTAVAEDIEWFRDDWVACSHPPSSSELRRSSSTLRQLLIHNTLQDAWRYCGFEKSPRIVAPNLDELLLELGQAPEHTVNMTAGGIEIDKISSAGSAMIRIQHPTTGVPADAEEGFAVKTGAVMKRVVDGTEDADTPLTRAVNFEWKSIKAYLDAPAAIRKGEKISRRSILTYFAHYSGGVHLDRAKNDPKVASAYAVHEELRGKVSVFGVEGLDAELLAMGQALGRSPDILLLANAIRNPLPAETANE